ncbi:HAMP domain-containing histidine kinase [Salibacteraceae bacterium]|nr:HAMP domain-containing histidine kinase [Salibacteraceae bacterium]
MNNKLITWLISGIIFSIVALISIQLFWINKAVSISHEEFERLVHKALSNVVEVLEQEEALKKIKTHQQGRFLFTAEDSVSSSDFVHDSSYKYFLFKELEKKEAGIEVRVVEEQGGKKTVTDFITAGQHRVDIENSEDNLSYHVNGEEGQTYYASDLQVNLDTAVRNQLVNKTVLVSDIVRSLMEVDLSEKIEDRVNNVRVDKLLTKFLLEEGIKLPYYFGVYDVDSDLKTGNFSDTSLTTSLESFEINLFPKDILGQKATLRVYFPKRIKYIFSSVSYLLFSSLLIIILIFFAFYYSIRTILKQKKVSEIKNDFINNMTHELKTPISTISLACEALSDPDISATPSLMNRYIGIIGQENKRLGVQVENVLKSAIWGSQAFKMNMEPVQMHSIIDEAVSKFQMQLDEKGGIIKMELGAKSDHLMADKVHITNAIYNLIDNAIKYTPTAPIIHIKTINEKDNLLVSVCDNGIGISKENHSKVFDKLYRVSTGNLHDTKGFGLGLNYVKTVVERHDGDVKVISKLNKGSTFTLSIPMNNIER